MASQIRTVVIVRDRETECGSQWHQNTVKVVDIVARQRASGDDGESALDGGDNRQSSVVVPFRLAVGADGLIQPAYRGTRSSESSCPNRAPQWSQNNRSPMLVARQRAVQGR